MAATATPGPGPSTTAAAAHAHVTTTSQRTPLRSLSLSAAKRATRSHIQRPVSILRKPSLPVFASSPPHRHSLSSATPVDQESLAVMQAPSPSAALSFPPLPPLPAFGASPSSASSTPPASGSSGTGQAARASSSSTGRSRVSFREDVDVAYAEALANARARSSRPSSSPPAATSSSCLPAVIRDPAPRRSSTDNIQALAKVHVAPRPVLKRAHSSQALRTNRGDDLFDLFLPQALRYPKVPPALARLSDGSIPPCAVWTPPSSSTESPSSIRKSAQLYPSPSLSPSSLPPGASAAAPHKSRKPRSPIPSWSSAATCPSLVSSSHRVSMASTLTAPSMTSLLLPPSPIDHIDLMPSSVSLDPALLHSPHYSPREILAAGDDLPDLEMPHPHHRTGRLHAGDLRCRTESPEVDIAAATGRRVGPETAREQPRRAIRSRQSTSNLLRAPSPSVSPFNSPPSSIKLSLPPPPPRAAQRLIRLQSSLADLRMQRRAEEDRQAAAAQARAAASSRLTARSVSPVSTPQPPPPPPRAPSPTLNDLIRKGTPGEEQLFNDPGLDSDDESDLDLSLSPLNAALRSHVIPSSSRLLVSSTDKSKAAAAPVDDGGWSGSESEEEEFSRTVARIAQRKPTAGGSLPTRLRRPAFSPRMSTRYSDFGMPSETPASPSAASDPSSSSADGGSSLGSRRSTANSIAAPQASGTAALINALVEQKYATHENLPRPKRFVEGWGAPEVLHDDEWPPDHGGGKLETLSEVW